MIDRPTILVLESITEEALQILQTHTDVITAPAPDRGPEVIEDAAIHGIVTRGKGKVNESLIDACNGLLAIARCGVGLDNVSVGHATKKGIKVINAPGSNADTVAEHTLALMLSTQRRMFDSIQAVNNNHWGYRTTYGGDELRGKTLGIIGMGDIGQRTAKLADAFGMKIIYYNRSEANVPYSLKQLEEVLETAHLISLHLPLTNDTRGMITASSFQNNPNRPILINTARGGIISDREIEKALDNNWLGAFAADVLEEEPPSTASRLTQMKNVFLTPHSASLTASTYNQMCVITVNHLIQVLKGQQIDERYIFNKL